MHSSVVGIAALVVATGLHATSIRQQAPTSVDSFTQSSHIVFIGRVAKVRATNVKALRATNATVVVRVEDLLDGPAAVAGLAGQDVTVELLRPNAMKPDQRAVFFANGVLFGEHLAVKEVGLLPPPSTSGRAALRAQIARVRAQAEDESLRRRLTTAVLVMRGRVVEISPLPAAPVASEHRPDWAASLIEVDSVGKGTLDSMRVTVYFPQSTDERWLLAPKFRTGDRGIWILHQESKFGLPHNALTALNPLDFEGAAEWAKIMRLLR